MAFGAWRLKLVACHWSLATSGCIALFFILVERIRNITYFFIPACSTASALVALFLSRAGLTLPDHGRRVGPELYWRLVDHMRGHTNN